MAQIASREKKVAPKVEAFKQEDWNNTIKDYLWANKPEQYIALMNMFSKSKIKIVTE